VFQFTAHLVAEAIMYSFKENFHSYFKLDCNAMSSTTSFNKHWRKEYQWTTNLKFFLARHVNLNYQVLYWSLNPELSSTLFIETIKHHVLKEKEIWNWEDEKYHWWIYLDNLWEILSHLPAGWAAQNTGCYGIQG
jgi:hypothetical protein